MSATTQTTDQEVSSEANKETAPEAVASKAESTNEVKATKAKAKKATASKAKATKAKAKTAKAASSSKAKTTKKAPAKAAPAKKAAASKSKAKTTGTKSTPESRSAIRVAAVKKRQRRSGQPLKLYSPNEVDMLCKTHDDLEAKYPSIGKDELWDKITAAMNKLLGGQPRKRSSYRHKWYLIQKRINAGASQQQFKFTQDGQAELAAALSGIRALASLKVITAKEATALTSKVTSLTKKPAAFERKTRSKKAA